MKDNFFEKVTAFQKKKSKTVEDYINYIKALTCVSIFEYDNDNYSYAALDLDKSDVEIIADYFTKLGFKCSYRSDFDEDFYRFYLEW